MMGGCSSSLCGGGSLCGWGEGRPTGLAGGLAAASRYAFALYLRTLSPLARASRRSASSASIRPRMAGDGRVSRVRLGIEMLIPACRPIANAAFPTVPAGTSINREAALAVVERTSATDSAPAVTPRIAKSFPPVSSPCRIALWRRRPAGQATLDHALHPRPTMCR